MIQVIIAEDHQSLMDGIDLLLKYNETIQVVGKVMNGQELVELVEKKQPDVIITDIKMPIMDGITATKHIKQKFPNIEIIAFSMFDQEDAVRQMLAAGAKGYLLKNSPLEEVISAIKTVAKGETFFDKGINPSLLNSETSTTKKKNLLSKSEREILKLIGEGKTSSEIGALRFTSVSTVEKHRKNMIKKLGVSGKGELLRYALERKYDF